MSTDHIVNPVLGEESKHDEDLIEKFRPHIQRLNQYIQDENPDYVVALSRSGPRLLKRFEKEGLIDFGANVITEKSLPFIENSKIENSDLVIFDDILIAGTTLWDWTSTLYNQYDIDSDQITATTLALDKDCAGLFDEEDLDNLPKNEVTISLDQETDYEKITYKTFCKLDYRDRFGFSKDLIHSIGRLNKPYDIDYALFNTILTPEDIDTLKKQTDIRELTTRKQKNDDLRRVSVFIDSASSRKFSEVVFNNQNPNDRISKLRIYYDETTGQTTWAPMFLFDLDEELLDNVDKDIFNPDKFGYLNDFVNAVRCEGTLDGADSKSKFRLIWYLVSYLFGIYAEQEGIANDIDLIGDQSPRQYLNYDDLTRIFGRELSSDLLELFENHHEDMQKTFDTGVTAVVQEEAKFAITPPEEFDENVKIIYNNITKEEEDEDGKIENLSEEKQEQFNNIMPPKQNNIDRLSKKNNLHSNLAIIFESLYSQMEFTAQSISYRMSGEEEKIDNFFGDLVNRLTQGFTTDELAGILSEELDIDMTTAEGNRQLSVAFDVLVDKGEQIPIFTKRETENGVKWTRAYRHGESAFILYDEFHDIMYYAFNTILGPDGGADSLSGVVLEKIGVLLWKSLNYKGIIDDLDDPESPNSIHVRNTFLPFGHTLDVVESSDDSTEGYEYEDIELEATGSNLVRWADDKGAKILKETEENDSHYKLHDDAGSNIVDSPIPFKASEDPFGERSLSYDMVQEAKSLSKLLYWVNKMVDPRSNAQYLIGLTSCSDTKSYLHALRKDIQSMFKFNVLNPEDSANVDLILDDLDDILSPNKSRNAQSYFPNYTEAEAEPLHTDYELKWPFQQTGLKIDVWSKMDDIVNQIDREFNQRSQMKTEDLGADTVPDLYTASGLPDFLQKIERRQGSDLTPENVDRFKHFTEYYARNTIAYCQTLWQFSELSHEFYYADSDDLKSKIKVYNYHRKALDYLISNPTNNKLPEEYSNYKEQLESITVPRLSKTKVNKRMESQTRSHFEKIQASLADIEGVLENIYDEQYEKEEFRDNLRDSISSIWKRKNKFLMYVDIENAKKQTHLENKLRSIGDKARIYEILVAEDTQELKSLFCKVVKTVHKEGEDAEVSIGIVSDNDVNEKIATDDFGRVKRGDHMLLAKELVDLGVDTASSNSSADRHHTLYITPDIRNAWGGILPESIESNMRIHMADNDPQWEIEPFVKPEDSKEINAGRLSFSPNHAFMSEEYEIDYFND